MKQLYDVQQTHAEVLAAALEKHRSAIDASSTGCGKTLVAADLVRVSNNPALVVCLKQSIPMWEREMADRGAPLIGCINFEMIRRGSTPYGSWQGPFWKWKLPTDSTIIWDEVQNCQGLDTLNSKLLIAAKPYYNLMLSATAAKDPTEMRALGYILGLHQLRNFWSWARENGCSMNPWNKLEFYKDEEMQKRVLLKLHHEIFPDHGSRLTTKDLAEHFQETQIITTPYEFGEELEAIFAEMEKEISNLEEVMQDDSKHPSAQALIAKLRARQRTELLKVPVMRDMALNLINEGRHVVVFFNYEESVQSFAKRFPHDIGLITGKNVKNRQQVMDDFQADKLPCVVANIRAGGVSINLHDITGNFPRSSLLSPSWNPKEVIQAIGRIHRAGGMTPSQQHVFFAANTVEEEVEHATRVGIQNISLINDGESKIVLV